MIKMRASYLMDFYKVDHIRQYPHDTKYIFTNWTPRSTRVPGMKKVVHFGMQYFIKEILKKEWDETFFNDKIEDIIKEYKMLIKATLGIDNPKTDHIEALHKLRYLPIEIFSIGEGYSVPLNCPMLVICNTHEDFFWLPNFFETILSNILWMPCTSATTALEYRKLFTKYALESGETDLSFIDFMGHDFSFRGMAGRESAILSGMGHLLSFSGTDTIPAIIAAHNYYGADLSCGGSVPATEHSVMCAGFQAEEFGTFVRLITETYPEGIVSIVSDTWDLWKVLTNYIPKLKQEILARNGKLVIRPDSGDPVKILCGDPDKPVESPIYSGALRLLAKALGVDTNRPGLPLINKAGLIYGDSITLDRADQILNRIVNELKLSPYNCVYGIGSYTYQYVTRDNYGFAMKATAVRRGDVLYEIFKKPVTDDGGKISHKGIVSVYRTQDSTDDKPEFFCVQGSSLDQLRNCELKRVYADGKLLIVESFDTIRKRVRNQCA